MFALYTTPTFEKRLRGFLKKHPELKSKIVELLDCLVENPFRPSLKSHRLSGVLRNNWAASLTDEYRILFLVEKKSICLTNIGSHDEIY